PIDRVLGRSSDQQRLQIPADEGRAPALTDRTGGPSALTGRPRGGQDRIITPSWRLDEEIVVAARHSHGVLVSMYPMAQLTCRHRRGRAVHSAVQCLPNSAARDELTKHHAAVIGVTAANVAVTGDTVRDVGLLQAFAVELLPT